MNIWTATKKIAESEECDNTVHYIYKSKQGIKISAVVKRLKTVREIQYLYAIFWFCIEISRQVIQYQRCMLPLLTWSVHVKYYEKVKNVGKFLNNYWARNDSNLWDYFFLQLYIQHSAVTKLYLKILSEIWKLRISLTCPKKCYACILTSGLLCDTFRSSDIPYLPIIFPPPLNLPVGIYPSTYGFSVPHLLLLWVAILVRAALRRLILGEGFLFIVL